jgi:phosphatidylglycerophosphate synthase
MIEGLKNIVRAVALVFAKVINHVFAGRINANHISIIGLLGHLPIVWLIAEGYHGYAAAGVIFFGLFDTLDGQLARLQNKSSNLGMLLDSVFDRIKEIMIYVGLAAYFNSAWARPGGGLIEEPLYGFYAASWLVPALGISLLISYLNAWGETILLRSGKSPASVNKLLRGGFMPYEIRISFLAFSLLFPDTLVISLAVISFWGAVTAAIRFHKIYSRL